MTVRSAGPKTAIKSLGYLALALGTPVAIGMTAEIGYAAPAPTFEPDMSSETLAFDKAGLDRNLALSTTQAAVDPQERECMAKVIHHEARSQSREGQLAVAQLMVNRRDSGRFADTICGVAAQRGQFFDVTQYNPREDSTWALAQDVAEDALEGDKAAVVPGALFYHATSQSAPAFFRTRQRVATLGDHIFYR